MIIICPYCCRRSILRSSSLHHLANSQPILEESESLTSSLSRLHNPPPSGSSTSSRNNNGSNNRAKSLFLSQQQVKSARYRPPGYFEPPEKDNNNHASTPVLSTFFVSPKVTTQFKLKWRNIMPYEGLQDSEDPKSNPGYIFTSCRLCYLIILFLLNYRN